MKIFTKVIAVLTVLAMLSVAAIASDFVSSPGKSTGIELLEGGVIITTPDYKDDAKDHIKDDLDETLVDLDKQEIEDLIGDFDSKWKDNTGAPIENAEITKVFHVYFDDDSATFKVRIDELGDKYILVAKNHKTGEWEYVNYTANGNEISITLNAVSTIVVVEDNGNGPVVDEPIQSPQTGVQSVSVVLAVSTVVLLAAAVVCFKKAKNVA